MDTDIRDAIDRSFDGGPPIDDLDLLLTRGRAAVRRRRLVEGGSMLLVAAAVTVIALASTSGSSPTSTPGPAGSPTASPTLETMAPLEPGEVGIIVDDRLHNPLQSQNPEPVRLNDDGFVHIQPGVEVLLSISNPYGSNPYPGLSVAVEYVSDGTTFWYAASLDETGFLVSRRTQAKNDMTFEGWVHEVDLTPAKFKVTVRDANGNEVAPGAAHSGSVSVHVATGGGGR